MEALSILASLTGSMLKGSRMRSEIRLYEGTDTTDQDILRLLVGTGLMIK